MLRPCRSAAPATRSSEKHVNSMSHSVPLLFQAEGMLLKHLFTGGEKKNSSSSSLVPLHNDLLYRVKMDLFNLGRRGLTLENSQGRTLSIINGWNEGLPSTRLVLKLYWVKNPLSLWQTTGSLVKHKVGQRLEKAKRGYIQGVPLSNLGTLKSLWSAQALIQLP